MSCQSDFDLTPSCIRLSETAFGDVSYPSACFRTHSMAFSSRWISNTLFCQRILSAVHPPHERVARYFNASSAYCSLDCHCWMLPHKDKAHTTPSPTTKEKTLPSRIGKGIVFHDGLPEKHMTISDYT